MIGFFKCCSQTQRPLRAAFAVVSLGALGMTTAANVRADELSNLPPAPFPRTPSPSWSKNSVVADTHIKAQPLRSRSQERQAPLVRIPITSQAPEIGATAIIKLQSDVPPYVDQKVAMVPLRPLLSFLGATATYHDGAVDIEQRVPFERSISMRVNSKKAWVKDENGRRGATLPVEVEERLGTVFVPLRFSAQALGAHVEHSPEGAGALVRYEGRAAVIEAIAQEGYRGSDATRIIIFNHIGKPLSLRLTGPQNIAVELGRSQSVSRSLRPGVYYYRAASKGMKPVIGVRRLLPGQKATWDWRRR